MNSIKATIVRKKHKDPYIYVMYVVSFVLLYIAVSFVSENEALDLGRYYQEAYDNVAMYKINELVVTRFYTWAKYDFLYQVILYVAVLLSIPLNLITTICLFVYCRLIVALIRKFYNGKMEGVVITIVLLTTPLTWTIEISRTLMAIMFLYAAILYLLEDKRMLAAVFVILCAITHFPTLMYVGVLAAMIPLRSVKIDPGFVFFMLLVFLIIGFIVPGTMQMMMTLFLSDDTNLSYAHYATDGIQSFWSTHGLGYGDKLPGLFAMFYSVYLILMNKKQGYGMIALFALTVMLFFFTNSSYFLVERTMMVMPLFWGWNVANIYSERNNDKEKVFLISLMGMIPIMLHFYAYRETYFPFFF